MFGFKEKIKLKTFVWEHFLPVLEEMVKSESGLLQQDIEKNDPPIKFSEDETGFEIFLLFLNASGRSLGLIAGFEGQVATQFPLVIDKIFKKKFANIKLNPQWLDKERGIVLSDTFNYYKNKMTAYHSVELLYNKGDMTKEDLHKKVSEIFFSIEADKINEPLITAIGELHKGGFMYLLQKLSAFSKKYRIVLE